MLLTKLLSFYVLLCPLNIQKKNLKMNLFLILQGSDFCKEQTSEFILEHKSLSIISLLVNLSLLKITIVYFKFSYVLQNFAYTYRKLIYVWCFSQKPLRCLVYNILLILLLFFFVISLDLNFFKFNSS